MEEPVRFSENVDVVILPTDPPMTVADVLDKADGVYFCIKDHNSVMLWANDNFARLVGQTKDQIIGKVDPRKEHVEHDKQVMASGKPLLNFHETIAVPDANGTMHDVPIVTQKGLLRKKGGDDIIGITVCFSLLHPDADGSSDDAALFEPDAEYWISTLGLTPSPVGGHFASGGMSPEISLDATLPERFQGDRALYSRNYYLLKAGEQLALHSLNQDEQWFFHAGSGVRLHVFERNGTYRQIILGRRPDLGQVLQTAAPHNTWFGAEVIGDRYALVSCSLAPGYDNRDSRRPTNEQFEALKLQFPDQAGVLERLIG